ncbi:NAD(P)-dependent methylenetetrahydromethanopterin dehydrogenase [Xanthobacter sp. DSM 24535]|uniref:NAD(P)-dependent methylenetetrahydromethanopterin dehydrogenase n=1 Tax=Roseixanthobacter psychrophilus TaxID=3119917 RepID=UPI0037267506
MATAAPILHMISPLPHVSPFDVNMAVDAGYAHVLPYPGVALDQVRDLTQDMMFSRAPEAAARTGLFIGGKDATLALDMADAARASLFPPFEISIFADPAGSFTTAAAMVAMVERALRAQGRAGLSGARVQVYGATGVVGGIAGVMAAKAGAQVFLVGHRDIARVATKADDFRERFGVEVTAVVARTDVEKHALIGEAEVILAAGRAGVEILGPAHLASAQALKVAADVNAVPPAGIAGIGPHDKGAALPHGVGIGALAIGNLKYRVQHALLRRLHDTDTALFIGLDEALALARDMAAPSQTAG